MPTTEERLEKLEDEAAIRNLAAAFADAATRHDMEELSATYKDDGVFTIGAPLLRSARGVQDIVALIGGLRSDKEFFVQFVHSGVIQLDGATATAQWLIEEAAKGGGKYYHNYCVVSDRLEKGEGHWLFAERYFHFAYLDFSPFTGNAYVLPPVLSTS